MVLIGISSCKKESDGEAPVVRIITPSENAVFNYGDVIPVKVQVDDNKQIDRITIEILDQQDARHLQSVQLAGNSSSQTFEASIEHQDLYLESGSYYIRVKASDGHQDAFDFQNIQINAAEKKLQRILLVRDTGNGSCSVDSMNASGSFTMSTFLHAADFSFADIKQNDLVVASNDELSMRSYDLPILFQEEIRNLDIDGGEIMTAHATDEKGWNNYLGFHDGGISILSENGLYQNAVFAANDEIIRHMVVTDQYIIAYSESADEVYHTINTYLKSSGALLGSVSLDAAISGMIEFEDGERLLLSQENADDPLVYFNIATNALNDVFFFVENSAAYGIWPASGQNYYVAHTTGLTYYNSATGSYQVYPIFNVMDVQYEPVTQNTYVLTTNGVAVYQENLSTLLYFHPMSNVKDIVFWYNK